MAKTGQELFGRTKKGAKKLKGSKTPQSINDRWLTEEGLEKVTELAAEGLTNDQLSVELGMSRSTFYKWQHDYPEFRQAVFVGKVRADREVVESLRALCFPLSISEQRAIKVKDIYYDDAGNRCQ